jgi:peptide chain release factor 1
MSPLVIELRAGEGGRDAEVFCTELVAALTAYVRQRKDQLSVLASQPGSRTQALEVEGPAAAYERLAGVHRVQRVPKNSTRRHTSTATIAVLAATRSATIDVPDSDLRLSFYRGSGPGGQHRNKTDTAVRLVHLPSGLVITAEDSRSQWSNITSAKRKLAEALEAEVGRKERSRTNNARRDQISTGERAAKQFTHNEQRGLVVCHETGATWRWSDFYRGRLERGEGRTN